MVTHHHNIIIDHHGIVIDHHGIVIDHHGIVIDHYSMIIDHYHYRILIYSFDHYLGFDIGISTFFWSPIPASKECLSPLSGSNCYKYQRKIPKLVLQLRFFQQRNKTWPEHLEQYILYFEVAFVLLTVYRRTQHNQDV